MSQRNSVNCRSWGDGLFCLLLQIWIRWNFEIRWSDSSVICLCFSKTFHSFVATSSTRSLGIVSFVVNDLSFSAATHILSWRSHNSLFLSRTTHMRILRWCISFDHLCASGIWSLHLVHTFARILVLFSQLLKVTSRGFAAFVAICLFFSRATSVPQFQWEHLLGKIQVRSL